MSRISRTRGKNTELAIAKELGAKRNHFEVEDLSHPILSIEVKHRESIPRTIVKWMLSNRKSHLDDLVVMRLGDLKDIVG